ncbi:hypothetical protein O181_013498 [Austropuccinia psidii MF-1]|uniref:Reverse transcriptase Ty1/copia-type domain-containing protein n=1 Tax=Austropuccinia psidii MF-1 TaxID=1389203 RepID=A0A9Q3GN61_9BASI|nr:hypothetical protein [Austropuccinia psidii MF-1]
MSNPIQTTGNHSSSDDEGYQTKIIILTHDNWVQWSCQLETFLAGKVHEYLLSPPSDSDKVSLEFKKRNSSALALLWTCVAPEVQGVLLAHQGSFYESWVALGKTCGKNSVVIMCETLFKLMSIQYEPGSSLEKHIDTFQRTFASYKSLTQGSEDTMVISATIAAAFFIRSLNQDRYLSAKPPNRTANCGKGKAPTRGRNKNRSNPNQKKDENSLKRLENLEKIVAKLELTGKNTNVNVVAEHSKELSADIQQSDQDAYVVEDEVLSIGHGESDKIYLNSGAGNLFSSRIDSQTIFNINTPQLLKDWHTTLGHPSDTYTKKLIRDKKLIGGFTSSSECQVCLHAKIKRLPHLHHLPVTHSPFVKLHMDTLEISPPSRQGFRYVLVIVDDFSRFNHIFLMTKKSISLEQGPSHSPQTNGVAERFNQSLLVKIRCLLAQSNVPISYWDDASLHASLILNLLPHQYLQTIIVVRNENTASKVNALGHSIKALTFEPFSDALRVLDPHTGKIRITRNYTQLKLETTVILRKNLSSLPHTTNPPQPQAVTLPTLSGQTSSTDVSRASQQVQNEPLPQVENHCPSPMPQTQTAVHKPRYDYVPHYNTALFDISSNLDVQNILSGEKRWRHPPNLLMLADVITYKQALTNPEESKAWQSAMKQKYDSLMNHNTGELVPYPSDGSKVIGGMWRLTRKRNEFGEVYRHKARWVALGNHQEHLLHYYDTWASVGRNETFKRMLILAVTQGYVSYQFDIETEFLHGEMDAVVYVKQVKGFEIPGKEGWVWRLNKLLYGTKQAPRMWQLKLVEVLKDLGMISTRADDSLYSNAGK